MNIYKTTGCITAVRDLTPTAREIDMQLERPIAFVAGSFVNVFMEINGVKIRRAFSISSTETKQDSISISVRLNPHGVMSPMFWKDDIVGTTVELMGPLGLNTADKMHSSNIYLFGFGIGAGVVKALTEHFVASPHVTNVTIITGSRSIEDIVHKTYFDMISHTYPHVHISYVLSTTDETTPTAFKKGYIQEHLHEYSFDNSDVYVCGQEAACAQLVETIKTKNPQHCEFFVEGFH